MALQMGLALRTPQASYFSPFVTISRRSLLMFGIFFNRSSWAFINDALFSLYFFQLIKLLAVVRAATIGLTLSNFSNMSPMNLYPLPSSLWNAAAFIAKESTRARHRLGFLRVKSGWEVSCTTRSNTSGKLASA